MIHVDGGLGGDSDDSLTELFGMGRLSSSFFGVMLSHGMRSKGVV